MGYGWTYVSIMNHSELNIDEISFIYSFEKKIWNSENLYSQKFSNQSECISYTLIEASLWFVSLTIIYLGVLILWEHDVC